MLDSQKLTVEIGRPQWDTGHPRTASDPTMSAGDQCEALDLIQDAVMFVHTNELRIISANAAACRMLGVSSEELRLRRMEVFFPDVDVESLTASQQRPPSPLHASCMRDDGVSVPVSMEAYRSHSQPDVQIVVVRDLRPLRSLAKLSQQPVYCDPLTGLSNLAVFQARLDFALSQNHLQTSPFAVLFIDLDGFKLVNDTYGHRAGDAVLKIAAQRLAACVRPGDVVARLGGDEFGALICDVSTEAVATRICKRIDRSLRQPIRVGEMTLTISASVGMRRSSAEDVAAEVLIDAADRAMYQVKSRRSAASQSPVTSRK